MKKENGVTLISVTIYVIAMVIVIAVITSLTGYFYSNVNINTESQDINKQYTKFNSFFSEQVNKSGNIIIEAKTVEKDTENEKSYIIFADKNQYTFSKKNKSIYFNNAKIATNIEKCIFTQGIENGKNIIEVTISAKNFNKTTKYTIKD